MSPAASADGRLARVQPFREPRVTSARGCWYLDDAGREHLDLLAGCWCTVLGHGHPRFTERLREQVGRLVHLGTGYLSPEVLDGADALLSTLDEDGAGGGGAGRDFRVVLLNTGSEAVDLALKLARAATGRLQVISQDRGYYGAGSGTYHLMGLPKGDFLGPAAGVHRFLAPDCAACPVERTFPACDFACLALSESLLDTSRAGGAAALVCEPVSAVGGMLFPPSGYLRRLEAIARRHEALFVINEVTTGGGRTGRWFAYQHEGVTPDIVVFGKAFGNGFPVAGVLVRRKVEEAAVARGLTHSQSHQNDPLTGFLVATVIGLVRDENLLERVRTVGRYLTERLRELAEGNEDLTEVRGLGLMAAFSAGESLWRKLAADRIVIGFQPAFRTFQLLPPYTISKGEIDHFVEALRRAMEWRK